MLGITSTEKARLQLSLDVLQASLPKVVNTTDFTK